MRAALVIVAGGLALGACSGREAEPNGVGPWRFGHSTLSHVHDGVCQPTTLDDGRKVTWCFAQQPFKIGKHIAEVDLYFDGVDKTAPLIELQMKVRGCVEDELDQWMRAAFGTPIETKPTRAYWKNSFVWAAAMMPSEPGRCLVRVLPLSENAEIERIKQKI